MERETHVREEFRPGDAPILVTGASGFFGRYILSAASERGPAVGTCFHSSPSEERAPSSIFPMDVADREAVRRAVLAIQPKAIVHAAALADWKRCEEAPALAWTINVEGTRHVAEAAREAGSRLVYVSTDLVFDGESAPYDERAVPRPICAYGRTKREGERLALELCEDACVARVSLLFGWSGAGRKSFSRSIVETVRSGGEVFCFVDECRTPLWAKDAAAMLVELALRTELRGVFHFSGGARVSRYELGIAICRAFSLPESRIRPARIQDVFPEGNRPRDCSLDGGATRQALGWTPRQLSEALLEMRKEERPQLGATQVGP